MDNSKAVKISGETIDLIKSIGMEYIKREVTQLRLPTSDEIGKEITTFVKDGDGVRFESKNVIKPFSIHARSSGVIGKDENGKYFFKEWLIDSEIAIKNYGLAAVKSLSENFSSHINFETIFAARLDKELIKLLQSGSGQTDPTKLLIEVDLSDEPMVANLGDYITSGGYSISINDMKDYSKVGQSGPFNIGLSQPRLPENSKNFDSLVVNPRMTDAEINELKERLKGIEVPAERNFNDYKKSLHKDVEEFFNENIDLLDKGFNEKKLLVLSEVLDKNGGGLSDFKPTLLFPNVQSYVATLGDYDSFEEVISRLDKFLDKRKDLSKKVEIDHGHGM